MISNLVILCNAHTKQRSQKEEGEACRASGDLSNTCNHPKLPRRLPIVAHSAMLIIHLSLDSLKSIVLVKNHLDANE